VVYFPRASVERESVFVRAIWCAVTKVVSQSEWLSFREYELYNKAPLLCHQSAEQKGRDGNKQDNFSLLILVESYAIDHYVIARPDVVNPDRDPYSNSRPYGIFIEDLTAAGDIGDRLSEMVSPRPASFLEHDRIARGVLRDRSIAFSCRCCGSGFRDLCPGEGSDKCQGQAK
jgi:hypothetical protein